MEDARNLRIHLRHGSHQQTLALPPPSPARPSRSRPASHPSCCHAAVLVLRLHLIVGLVAWTTVEALTRAHLKHTIARSKSIEQAGLPETSPEKRRRLLSIVVVGGGPTGVEVRPTGCRGAPPLVPPPCAALAGICREPCGFLLPSRMHMNRLPVHMHMHLFTVRS